MTIHTSKVAVITGGTRGIGRAIAARLAKEGAQVVIWARNVADFDPEVAGFEPALIQRVDVSDLDQVEAALAEIVKKLKRIDIMVNNAGINGLIASVVNYPPDAWDAVLRVDLSGVFYCCRSVLPYMTKGRWDRIINVASIAGKEASPGISAYAAAKAGVIAFSKTLAREVVSTGVTVNCVAPAITQTELFDQMTPEHIETNLAKVPMQRFLTPPEIAAMVSFIASEDCSFTTGFVFDLTGGRANY